MNLEITTLDLSSRRKSTIGYTIRMEDFAPDRPARFALTSTNHSLAKCSTAAGATPAVCPCAGIGGRVPVAYAPCAA